MKTVPFWGYELSLDTKDKCVEQLFEQLSHGKSQHVVTLNPEMILAAEKDNAFADVLKNATMCIPDGIGLVWALMRRGVKAKRLPGIELSEAILAQAEKDNISVAFIGASPEVMEALKIAIAQKYPQLNVVYTHHGFFNATTEAESILADCIQAKPKIIFLALGFPRQEFWIAENQSKFFTPTLMVGVGGSFDVWSGLKKRAPKIFRDCQAEWFYRIASEPWRIQRVAKTLPQFLVRAVFLGHNKT